MSAEYGSSPLREIVETTGSLLPHRQAEYRMGLAEIVEREGRIGDAAAYYRSAALCETVALDELRALVPFRPHTYSIIAVSAVSLWRRAGDILRAQELRQLLLSEGKLQSWAIEALAPEGE